MEQIIEDFKTAVMKYYTEAKAGNIVRYNKIHAILTNLPGVLDFEDLKLNGEEKNLSLDQDEYPGTNEVLFE